MSTGHSIAIMNAKGGVGKSTLTMALGRSPGRASRRRVLVIDSDGQVSVSLMLLPIARLQALRDADATLVDIIAQSVLQRQAVNWRSAAAPQATDLEDAEELYIVPGSMDLTLVEREITVTPARWRPALLHPPLAERCQDTVRRDPGRLRAGHLGADRMLAARMRSPYRPGEARPVGRRRHGIPQELQTQPRGGRLRQPSRRRHQHARSELGDGAGGAPGAPATPGSALLSGMPSRTCSICRRPASIRRRAAPSCRSIREPPGAASRALRKKCWAPGGREYWNPRPCPRSHIPQISAAWLRERQEQPSGRQRRR